MLDINEQLRTRQEPGDVTIILIWLFNGLYNHTSYGTAHFKLDNETHVALELLNKFVRPLASFTQVYDLIS